MITYRPNKASNAWNAPYICHVTTRNGKITDPTDKKFIDELRTFVKQNAPGNRIVARGRNSDRVGIAKKLGVPHSVVKQSVPVKNATEVSLYLRREGEDITTDRQVLNHLTSMVKQHIQSAGV
jgi:hypothetical protein